MSIHRCRNPLSLDMGWKSLTSILTVDAIYASQSAFAGYGLEAGIYSSTEITTMCRNPLSLDMGWK